MLIQDCLFYIYGNIFFFCNQLDQQDNYLIYMHKHVGSKKSDIILIIPFQKSQMQVIWMVTIHFSCILPSNKALKRLGANLMRKLVIMKYTHFYDIVIIFYIFSFAAGIIASNITYFCFKVRYDLFDKYKKFAVFRSTVKSVK